MANLQKGVLEKITTYLSKKQFSYEVVIVDDGSMDGSIEFVEEFVKDNKNFRLIKNPHTGKAGAVTAGVLKAKGEYILFTDMDQATPIEEVEKLLPHFEEGFDVVIGSRKNQRKGAPLSRLLISRGMILLRTIVVGMSGISDTQCGFKMFKRSAAFKIFPAIHKLHNGFRKISGSAVTAGFDVELLFLAQKMGYKISEVPVKWLYVETRRVNPIKDSVYGLKDLVVIRLNDIQGKYKVYE